MDENQILILNNLKQSLPPIFTRKEISRLLGGSLDSKTLRNMDSLGLGPSIKLKIGKKISYERDSFIDWLKKFTSR